MDYSAVANEASPWGSSSPRNDRSGFSGSAEPDSPTPVRHSHTQSQDSLPEAALFTSQTLPTGDVEVIPQTLPSEADQRGLAGGIQNQSQEDDGLQQAEQSHVQPQTTTQQSQQRPGAARYHSARQQRPVPQYKLQAKVTALERTGRKDPVLRFDVYVRNEYGK